MFGFWLLLSVYWVVEIAGWFGAGNGMSNTDSLIVISAALICREIWLKK